MKRVNVASASGFPGTADARRHCHTPPAANAAITTNAAAAHGLRAVVPAHRRDRCRRGRRARIGVPQHTSQVDDDLAHGLVTVRWLALERLLDDRVKRGRAVTGQRRRGAVHDLLQHLEIGRAAERPVAGQQFVEHDAERKDVAARIERLPRPLLGRHVGDGADDDALPRALHRRRVRRVAGLIQLRETEVGELGVAALGDQNVFRLDVAMQDARRMRDGQTVGHADQELHDLPPRPPALSGPILQRAAVHVLDDQILTTVFGAGFEHRQDVWMVERRGGLRLLLEALEYQRIGDPVGEHLDRHRTRQSRVMSAIDFAHAAGADPFDDFVEAESSARSEAHEGRVGARSLPRQSVAGNDCSSSWHGRRSGG